MRAIDSETVEAEEKKVKKKAWLAVLLNLFTFGLGHIYAGKVKKGILLFLVLVCAVLSIRFLAFNFPVLIILLSVILVYYCFGLVDAFLTVRKKPFQTQKKHDKWYFYVAVINLQLFLPDLIPFHRLNSLTPISFNTVGSVAMSPTLELGDYCVTGKVEQIKHNDILVYKKPSYVAPESFFMFRCLGLPGDKLEISDGYAVVHTQLKDDPSKLKFSYILSTSSFEMEKAIQKRFTTHEYTKIGVGKYLMYLTDQEKNELSEYSGLDTIGRYSGDYRVINSPAWQADHFGPLMIPAKGQNIALNEQNLRIYVEVVFKENPNYELQGSRVFLKGEEVSSHTFDHDYYFVLGDNRNNALDSRFLGFIRDDEIVGKVLYLHWANDLSRVGQSF